MRDCVKVVHISYIIYIYKCSIYIAQSHCLEHVELLEHSFDALFNTLDVFGPVSVSVFYSLKQPQGAQKETIGQPVNLYPPYPPSMVQVSSKLIVLLEGGWVEASFHAAGPQTNLRLHSKENTETFLSKQPGRQIPVTTK